MTNPATATNLVYDKTTSRVLTQLDPITATSFVCLATAVPSTVPKIYVYAGRPPGYGSYGASFDAPELNGIKGPGCDNSTLKTIDDLVRRRLPLELTAKGTHAYATAPMINIVATYHLVWVSVWSYNTTFTDTAPEPATNCTAKKNGDISFGNVAEKNLEGTKATTNLILECTGDATVRVRFVNVNDPTEGSLTLKPNLTGFLLVGAWPGAGGFPFTVKKGIPQTGTLNVVLSPSGPVTPGTFQGNALVKVEVQ
nr:hypothetical protein [Serratia entomophila]